ncbi:MAG TPA: STAS domain-containing protein [Telmatospirillum sp.]|nr:STAS domain-containing protein [Telmatospirillum sp.]
MTDGIDNVIAWDGEISVSQAEEVHDRFCAALADGRPIVVDCGAIEDADISFIQLLIAARTSARRRGVSFCLKQPVGEPFLAVLRRGGFLLEAPLPQDDFWTGGA